MKILTACFTNKDNPNLVIIRFLKMRPNQSYFTQKHLSTLFLLILLLLFSYSNLPKSCKKIIFKKVDNPQIGIIHFSEIGGKFLKLFKYN